MTCQRLKNERGLLLSLRLAHKIKQFKVLIIFLSDLTAFFFVALGVEKGEEMQYF